MRSDARQEKREVVVVQQPALDIVTKDWRCEKVMDDIHCCPVETRPPPQVNPPYTLGNCLGNPRTISFREKEQWYQPRSIQHNVHSKWKCVDEGDRRVCFNQADFDLDASVHWENEVAERLRRQPVRSCKSSVCL